MKRLIHVDLANQCGGIRPHFSNKEATMIIKNLTEHDVKIKPRADNELVLTINPSGVVARVEMTYERNKRFIDIGFIQHTGPILGIPTTKYTFGRISGLPEPEPDKIYIVSDEVAQAVPNRVDLYLPDTGENAVRDDNGNLLYVTDLIQYYNPYIEELGSKVEGLEEHIEMRNRIDDSRQKRNEENARLDAEAREREEQAMEDLRHKNWDLQDEVDNKDHVWGTSRK